jgi:hypothetical protein
MSSSSHSHVTLLKWCDKIKLSNLLLPRESGAIKRLQRLSKVYNDYQKHRAHLTAGHKWKVQHAPVNFVVLTGRKILGYLEKGTQTSYGARPVNQDI